MTEDKYAWQEETYDLWKQNGYRGVLHATVSAGKTIAGCKVISKYLDTFGKDSEIWVLAPTHEILDQWAREPLLKGKNITFSTYLTAVSKIMRRYLEDKYDVPDMLILDECHTSMAPVAGKILNFGIPHILGLSATPNGSERALGGIIQEVGWGSSNISPVTIEYTFFKPTKEEMESYTRKTQRIEKYKEDHPYSNMYNDQRLSFMYLQRRDYVYKMKSRIPIALDILKKNLGRKMMVFFERKQQVMDFSKLLDAEGIDHCIHITGNEHLDEYIDDMKDIVLCCKKLQAGFNSPSTEVGIIVSTPVGKVTHIQTVGRILRPKEGKHANVYVLIAEGTTDEQLYKTRNQMFASDMTTKVNYHE